MIDWLHRLLAELAGSPLLQAVVAALATFVLEDPTTVGAGLLVADGKMSLVAAFLGVSAGIAVGDLGLYGAGRLLGPRIVGRGPLTPKRMARARSWFRRNLVQAVVLSRFVPGMRLPTYVGAGMLRAPFWRFAATAAAASVVWTALLLTLTVQLGEAVLPLLGRWRWPVAAAALAALLLLQRIAAGRIEKRSRMERNNAPTFSRFELWPAWFFYLPVFFYWLWLAVRYRGLLLPTAANPLIYSGGFIGERKSEILALVPDSQRRWFADWAVVEAPEELEPGDSALERAQRAMREAGLVFPVVAKPDIGQRGAGVQPINDTNDLAAYAQSFPTGERFLLQTMVGRHPPGKPGDHPSGFADVREAGVMWWREPGQPVGRIFSVTLKISPEVVGDGRRTLAELIDGDPRASRIADVYMTRHAAELDRILAEGRHFPLVFAGNHCQGAIFRDGTHLITPELEQAIERIARAIPELWFCRFDALFDDLDGFLAGKDMQIVEVNGASAEATHIWAADTTLRQAYHTLFEQFHTLFRIGAANRRRGHSTLPVWRFFFDLFTYGRLRARYPRTR